MNKKNHSLVDLVVVAAPVLLGLAVLAAVLAVSSCSPSPSDSALKEKSVKLVGEKGGSCSGEQVRAPSGVDYILTAAHCKVLESEGSIKAITEDGRVLKRRVIAEDPQSDLLLLEGLPGVRGLPIAKEFHRAQHIRTFTHGAGYATYRTEGSLIQMEDIQVILFVVDEKSPACDMPKHQKVMAQSFFGPLEVCVLSVKEVVTDALIVPGSSGGMVVDDSGELIGVVSAGNSRFGMLVPLTDIQRFVGNY